jgi:hypothetical protein
MIFVIINDADKGTVEPVHEGHQSLPQSSVTVNYRQQK